MPWWDALLCRHTIERSEGQYYGTDNCSNGEICTDVIGSKGKGSFLFSAKKCRYSFWFIHKSERKTDFINCGREIKITNIC